jgi:hypothetical protein
MAAGPDDIQVDTYKEELVFLAGPKNTLPSANNHHLHQLPTPFLLFSIRRRVDVTPSSPPSLPRRSLSPAHHRATWPTTRTNSSRASAALLELTRRRFAALSSFLASSAYAVSREPLIIRMPTDILPLGPPPSGSFKLEYAGEWLSPTFPHARRPAPPKVDNPTIELLTSGSRARLVSISRRTMRIWDRQAC